MFYAFLTCELFRSSPYAGPYASCDGITLIIPVEASSVPRPLGWNFSNGVFVADVKTRPDYDDGSGKAWTLS